MTEEWKRLEGQAGRDTFVDWDLLDELRVIAVEGWDEYVEEDEEAEA